MFYNEAFYFKNENNLFDFVLDEVEQKKRGKADWQGHGNDCDERWPKWMIRVVIEDTSHRENGSKSCKDRGDNSRPRDSHEERQNEKDGRQEQTEAGS